MWAVCMAEINANLWTTKDSVDRVVPILKMQQSRWPIGITRLLSTGFALLLPGPGGREGGQEQIPAWPLLTVTCGPNSLTSLFVTGRDQHLPKGGTR